MGNKHGIRKSEPSGISIPKGKYCAQCAPGTKQNRNPLMRAAQEGHSDCLKGRIGDFKSVWVFPEAIDEMNADGKTA